MVLGPRQMITAIKTMTSTMARSMARIVPATPGDAGRRGTRSYTRRPVAARSKDPLAPFGPAVRAWFEATFETPTPAQSGGWAAIASGSSTLIHAPTGSGKTLAAFLWCLDRLVADPRPAPSRTGPGSVRVLYISPLKALAYDVERNLRAPLAGIALAAARLGQEPPRISIASRTGDTPADERRALVRHPPDILITTPESL
jgi:ATP-dependent helicase Lhr and Lhr-like helicase